MYWNRFRYWLAGRSPWGYFGRLSGPETSPDYLVYRLRPNQRGWVVCRIRSGRWFGFTTARTLKEAKRLCENDFIGRYNHG